MTPRREQWLGQGLESLLAEQCPQVTPFDALIIGSGYGGAVAAQRLCQQNQALKLGWRIGLLERGREYLPGAFPSTEAELPGHLRFTTPQGTRAQGQMEGLFDVRVGHDVSVVLANGVGGGSLINAGVMALPQPDVLKDPAWPRAHGDPVAFAKQAEVMRNRLMARPIPASTSPLKRMRAMSTLGAQPVPITVAHAGEHYPQSSVQLHPCVHSGSITEHSCCPQSSVQLHPCVHCGDCATGCNHGAKISLDLSLLKQARDQGLQLYSGATVSRIRRARPDAIGPLWEVEVWHTDATLRKRMAQGVWIRTRRLVLAAGALGSTELLMRSQSDDLQFSPQLGRRFSANGDVLAALHGGTRIQRGVADQEQDPPHRGVGPTITSMVDWRNTPGTSSMVVQDLGVPGALARFFGEGITTAALLHSLDKPDHSPHGVDDRRPDPCAVDHASMQRSLAIALILRDKAAGVMSPAPDNPLLPQDAGLRIDWPGARLDPRIAQAHLDLEKALGANGDLGGLLPNPMWRLLPPRVSDLLGSPPGPLLTVHPLGGCAMADDCQRGVVNAWGQVFDASPGIPVSGVLPGLLVLDGAIVPTSLGINPALTIATLADLALSHLLATPGTGWSEALPTKLQQASALQPLPLERPRYAPLAPPVRRTDTQVQVIERLSGEVDLLVDGKPVPRAWMELDIVYHTKALFPRRLNGRLKRFSLLGHTLPVAVDSQLSRLRIFPLAQPGSRFDPDRDDSQALLVAPLAAGGELHFLHREASDHPARRCRAWRAWLGNRGTRDIYQALAAAVDKQLGRPGQSTEPLNIGERWRQSLALASRAGEVRLFDYTLPLQKPSQAKGDFAPLSAATGLQISGQKRLTYERRSNPFTQLSRLVMAPGEPASRLRFGAQRNLDLCPAYLAVKGMPLIRIVEQQDQPTALLDVLSFGLFITRILINVHLWSFRKPDAADPREPQRLPGKLPGLPGPVVHEWQPDGASHGQIRLTHYPHPKARQQGRVVLMIHGYSASGTTFAHPSLEPSLAGRLHQQGYEPWIVDLRTSCGMPTADQPWTFEDIALADVPAAIREVCARTGAPSIHLITHCMGSAMLAMLLQSDHPSAAASAPRLRSWTMSQFGPRLVFSPANTLRAYLVSWWRQAIPRARYELRPGPGAPGADANLYDRLIAALPYLNDQRGSEFDRENPSAWTPCRRTPWVGTRHRLDALIGRTFDSRNMSDATLAAIDDFFGPINLATTSPALARWRAYAAARPLGWMPPCG